MKTVYVRAAARGPGRARGDRAAGAARRGWPARSRTVLWVRSWLSIYDLEDLLGLRRAVVDVRGRRRVEAFLADRPGSAGARVGLGRLDRLARPALRHRGRQRRARPGLGRPDARALAARDAHNVELRVVEPVPAVRRRAARPSPVSPASTSTDYVDAIDDVDGPLDLIVIDGRAREACLVRAVDRLADGGLIVLRQRRPGPLPRRDRRASGRDSTCRWTRGRHPGAAVPDPHRAHLGPATGREAARDEPPARWLDVLRGVFLRPVLGFAWWGLHDQGDELLDRRPRTSALGTRARRGAGASSACRHQHRLAAAAGRLRARLPRRARAGRSSSSASSASTSPARSGRWARTPSWPAASTSRCAPPSAPR